MKYKEMFLQGGSVLDVYTPFHEYFAKLMLQGKGNRTNDGVVVCEECPLAHKWVPYFEAYHDRFQRLRNGPPVTFLEIGVQSGGSIAMWKEYFGFDRLTYIGLDINPETQRFHDPKSNVYIHIGDSQDPEFLKSIQTLYPDGVDILLDDGGHTMDQQLNTFKYLVLKSGIVKPNGIYACEDLATSWSEGFGGIPNGNIGVEEFRDKTMMGRIHHAVDWLHAGFIKGSPMAVSPTADQRPQGLYPQFKDEYQAFLQTFKSIHVYNQITFFERGTYNQIHLKTNGANIPYGNENTLYSRYQLPWDVVQQKTSQILNNDTLENYCKSE